MKEFYEPMLYLSAPDHPNTMGALVGLKEPVDGDILRGVVEELRARFPYYYVRAAAKENDLVPVPNPLHMTVRNSWDPINLNSEESNYHLAAWKYEGKRLAFEISHSLTDGAGILPYIKSALYLYLSRKTGKNFDSTGFRLPGDDIPTSETGNPFATLDIDSAEAPPYSKAATTDFYRLNAGAEESSRVTYIRLSEAQLMLQQLDEQSAFNKTYCYYWSYPGSNPDIGAAHSVELMFVFNLRGIGTNSAFNGTNIPDEIFTTVQQMWTNFARCGNPSTDQIEWKEYSADDQNVMVIAGPEDMHIEQGLLSDQYKAVLPLVGYYQFMDKYFTPGYLSDILAAREQ